VRKGLCAGGVFVIHGSFDESVMSSSVSAGRLGLAAQALRSGVLARVSWALLFTLSMLIGLAARPLTEPDEGRNAEIAREMLASGDYVLPSLNALPHADKPPVSALLVAGSFRLLGVSETSARLPGLLATLLTALLTGALAGRLFGAGAAWLACGALLVSPLTWAYGQIVILDSLFTLWVVAAIAALYLAVETAIVDRRARLGWSLAGWGCIAVAILTKGPVGLLLPLLVMTPYAAWQRRVLVVLDWRGALLAAALVAPWVWLMDTRVPGFLRYVALVETWERVTADTLHRSKPFWYFIPMLLIGAFPWSAVAISGVSRALRAWRSHGPQSIDRRWLLLALWILLPLIFFSLSRSKLPHYVLPLVPAFCLLVAGLWASPGSAALPGMRGACWTWLVVGVVCGVAIFLPVVRNLEEPWRSQALVLALVGCAAGLAAGLIGLSQRTMRASTAVWIVSSPALLLYVALQPFLVSLSDALSSRELARAIRDALPAGGQVVGVHAFPPSLPFYLGRPIEVASGDGSELTSNYLTLTYSKWLGSGSTLHPEGFWQGVLQACPAATVFVANTWESPVRNTLKGAGLPLLASNAWYEVYGPCAAGGP
jgi:4-amino-4-deoxy-L-arabinose transferase-like glycosyltransferase